MTAMMNGDIDCSLKCIWETNWLQSETLCRLRKFDYKQDSSKCKTRKQIDNYWTGLHKRTCVMAASSPLCCYRVNQFSQKSIPPVQVWLLMFVFLCNCSYRGDFLWKFKEKGLKGAKGYWVQVVGRMLHTFVPFRQHEHLIFAIWIIHFENDMHIVIVCHDILGSAKKQFVDEYSW